MKKVLKYEAFDLFEAEVSMEEHQIKFWLKEPKFLLGKIPFKDKADFEYILKNVDSLKSMKKMFEEHKYLL